MCECIRALENSKDSGTIVKTAPVTRCKHTNMSGIDLISFPTHMVVYMLLDSKEECNILGEQFTQVFYLFDLTESSILTVTLANGGFKPCL